MAGGDTWGMNDEQHRVFLEMLRWWQRQPKGTGDSTSLFEPRQDVRPPIVACLLDPLNSGQSVMATVLTRRSLNNIQTITSYGSPPVGYFRVGFKASSTATPEWTPNFYPAVDTAATMKKYLGALPSVGKKNVQVNFGLVTTPQDNAQHNMWRWQVVFGGVFSGVNMQPLQIDSHLTGAAVLVRADNPLEDTGQLVSIFCPVPVSVPTPLRAGAIIMACDVPPMGYCIHCCEVRDFGDYGLF